MGRNLPIFSATAARLLFFGGRYVSVLLVARLAGAEATGFLLAVAIVEVLRIVFDYGLENSVLARTHQQQSGPGVAFARGKGALRWCATLVGQLVTSALVAVLCAQNNTPLALPLLASLQFSCLMGFGYLQAHLQTGRPGAMAALVPPLALAVLVQSLLLWLSYQGRLSLLFCTICFELLAMVGCALVARKFGDDGADGYDKAKRINWSGQRAVWAQIAPLGNVALIGIAYNRLDAFAVSLVASGALLTQYLVYQRLASAPLMFFSTVASASISTLSASQANPEELRDKITRFRQLAYGVALFSGIALAAFNPLIMVFFSLKVTDHYLLAAQAFILALQISNGFHASMLIACRKVTVLWRMAQRNAIAAIIVLPGAIWLWGGLGIAIALCLVEAFCAAQHVWEFGKSEASSEKLHA